MPVKCRHQRIDIEIRADIWWGNCIFQSEFVGLLIVELCGFIINSCVLNVELSVATKFTIVKYSN